MGLQYWFETRTFVVRIRSFIALLILNKNDSFDVKKLPDYVSNSCCTGSVWVAALIWCGMRSMGCHLLGTLRLVDDGAYSACLLFLYVIFTANEGQWPTKFTRTTCCLKCMHTFLFRLAFGVYYINRLVMFWHERFIVYVPSLSVNLCWLDLSTEAMKEHR